MALGGVPEVYPSTSTPLGIDFLLHLHLTLVSWFCLSFLLFFPSNVGALPTKLWIVGDSHIYWAAQRALLREGMQLGLDTLQYEVTWKRRRARGARLAGAVQLMQ